MAAKANNTAFVSSASHALECSTESTPSRKPFAAFGRAAICRAGPHRDGDEPKPMMNEREKSDPAVVAGKSTNEAGQPGEEWVEPRAGTKGNAA